MCFSTTPHFPGAGEPGHGTGAPQLFQVPVLSWSPQKAMDYTPGVLLLGSWAPRPSQAVQGLLGPMPRVFPRVSGQSQVPFTIRTPSSLSSPACWSSQEAALPCGPVEGELCEQAWTRAVAKPRECRWESVCVLHESVLNQVTKRLPIRLGIISLV